MLAKKIGGADPYQLISTKTFQWVRDMKSLSLKSQWPIVSGGVIKRRRKRGRAEGLIMKSGPKPCEHHQRRST